MDLEIECGSSRLEWTINIIAQGVLSHKQHVSLCFCLHSQRGHDGESGCLYVET